MAGVDGTIKPVFSGKMLHMFDSIINAHAVRDGDDSSGNGLKRVVRIHGFPSDVIELIHDNFCTQVFQHFFDGKSILDPVLNPHEPYFLF